MTDDETCALVGDTSFRYFQRQNTPMIAPTKGKEFLRVLQELFDCSDLEKFEPVCNEDGSSMKMRDVLPDSSIIYYCICSQIILNQYFIRFTGEATPFGVADLSGTPVQVGSCCVEKLNINLYKGLKNGICKVCATIIKDKRKKVCRSNYCSESCVRRERAELEKARNEARRVRTERERLEKARKEELSHNRTDRCACGTRKNPDYDTCFSCAPKCACGKVRNPKYKQCYNCFEARR